MKNIFKKFVLLSVFATSLSLGANSAFAQWDTASGGNYAGGWDTASGGNSTSGWDTASGGNYTGGWDTASGGNYTGGWNTGTTGAYTGGWDTTSVTGSTYTTLSPSYYGSSYYPSYYYPSVGYVGASFYGTSYVPSTYTSYTSTYVPPVITPTAIVYSTSTYVAPTITYPSYTYTSPTISYQTCWDGSTIPSYSVCPSQYKVCANGTSVPLYQNCYYGGSYVAPYVAPQPVKFNNVVTSVATEVTKTSGRCNGIGLVANNVPSTGWFEYGETSNLGRNTTAVSIGSSATSPFSNVLTNLKPSTTYYCRAVMQNQYGIVKGEIVGFTTKSTTSNYVKPVVTKKITKTNKIICSDGSTVIVKDNSSATLLSQGQKLVSLQIEKLSGDLASKNTVSYRLSYKNISDSRLSNVLIKVTLPKEVIFTSSSAGSYDQATHTITLNQDTIDSSSEGVITWTGEVTKDAPIGKSIVTTAYVLYTVPSTSVQDEVTAYVVGSIVPQSDGFAQAKHVIGQGDRSFLPNSLVEWLALVAIIFIIFILGRSIYASYQEDKENSH